MKEPPSVRHATFTQFTDQAGPEYFPSLSPEGNMMIYASRESGNWDIYLQRVGGTNAMNLTKDSPADDTQAVYSPDGEQITFHSDRDGGGIFLMGATGENVRRISDSGYYPAWSPDGTEIVFCSGTFNDPTDRATFPASLWAVNIATGEKRGITTDDAVQPSWSPHGERIAFWGIDDGGIRDIKTVAAAGGESVAVTADAAFDWNPVWSPDGKYLYFASNRGGSMNFWRVPIDEKSGKTLGHPEPFTTPAVFSQHLAFSSNGKRMAFVQATNSSHLMRAELNPQTETVVQKITAITQGARIDRNPAVSPDGQWLAFDAIKDKQEDLFVIKHDGSNLRQLTNDINKDRAPRWSPDGQKLIFYSDRSGKYESWTININGTDLNQITFDSGPYGMLSFWSPDGRQILQNITQGHPKLFAAEKSWAEQTPVQLPASTGSDRWMMAFSWSPDGEKIAAMRMGSDPAISGIVIYSLRSQSYEEPADFGESPVWLSDSRRVIFFEKNRVFLLDSLTAKIKEILTLPPAESLQGITVSPDDRSMYYSLQKKEADIWLATLE
jgi:Tol biopolymer transport system component